MSFAHIPTLLDIHVAYRQMLRDRAPESMMIMADALEEQGFDQMASAYRWAAQRERWPLRRARRIGPRYFSSGQGRERRDLVADWESVVRIQIPAADHARLPHSLYLAIRQQKDKKYGSVHRAFIMLAMALQETGEQI